MKPHSAIPGRCECGFPACLGDTNVILLLIAKLASVELHKFYLSRGRNGKQQGLAL